MFADKAPPLGVPPLGVSTDIFTPPASEYEGMFPQKVGPTSKYDWIEPETASYDKIPQKDYLDVSKSVSSEDISGLTRTGTWQDQMGGQLMGDFKEATSPKTNFQTWLKNKGHTIQSLMQPGELAPLRAQFLREYGANYAQGGRVGYKTGGRVGILAAF